MKEDFIKIPKKQFHLAITSITIIVILSFSNLPHRLIVISAIFALTIGIILLTGKKKKVKKRKRR